MDIGEPGRGGPRQRPWVVRLFFYSLKCFFCRRVNLSPAKMEMSLVSDHAARARCYNKRCNNPHFNKFRYDMDGNSVPPLCIQSLQAYTHTQTTHTCARARTHTQKTHTRLHLWTYLIWWISTTSSTEQQRNRNTEEAIYTVEEKHIDINR